MKICNRRSLTFIILILLLLLWPTFDIHATQGRDFSEEKTTAEDYYRKWLSYFDKGEYANSIQFMKKAIRLDPSYSTKIKEHIEKTAKLAEGKGTAEDYYNIWLTYFDEGEYEESIQFMKRAIELDPSYSAKIRGYIDRSVAIAEGKGTAEDYYNIWLAYFDEGEYEKSIHFMKSAIELNPSYSAKIREDVDQQEREVIAKIDVEAKRKEILAKERARELAEKKARQEEEAIGRKQLKFGPATFSPYIAHRFTWDDNIFLTHEDPWWDFISELMPGLKAKVDLPFRLPLITRPERGAEKKEDVEGIDHTLIDFEYAANIKNYFQHASQSNVGHMVAGATTIPSNLFGGKGKLIFGMKDVFVYTTDPPNSESGTPTPRGHNDMEVKARYIPSEKMSMAMAYKYVIERYRQETMEDYRYSEHIITPTVFYNITPKTSLFLDTDLGRIIYDHSGNRDSRFVQISGGITGRVTPKTNVYFKAGGQIRNYKHDEIYNDYIAFTTKGALSSQLRKDVLMKLTLTKEAIESTYQDNAYFDFKQLNLELVKSLTGKASVMAGGTFGRSDYPRNSTEDEEDRIRRDYIWGFKSGISYQFLKGFDSNLTYEFKGRDSNFEKYKYRDNRITATVKAAY